MKATVDFFKTRRVYVRVNLSRCDTFVPEHLLDLAQIGAPLEKMRSETVPERVRANRFGRANSQRVFLNEFPERFPAHLLAASRHERVGRALRSNFFCEPSIGLDADASHLPFALLGALFRFSQNDRARLRQPRAKRLDCRVAQVDDSFF